MSTLVGQVAARRRFDAGSWLEPLGIVVALAGAVLARWLATRAGADGLVVGATFGLSLAALAAAAALAARGRARLTPRASDLRGIAIGLAAGLIVGLALIGVAVLGPALANVTTVPGLGRPVTPFLPWVAVTLLVVGAEEAVLRGALLDRVTRAGGLAPALVATSVAFALLHVPLYGWPVVPLDLAVGFVLGGLRVATRTIVAPIAAHALADLATWWL
jgi:membrane protease YdiL (CAAX protease family)